MQLLLTPDVSSEIFRIREKVGNDLAHQFRPHE